MVVTVVNTLFMVVIIGIIVFNFSIMEFIMVYIDFMDIIVCD